MTDTIKIGAGLALTEREREEIIFAEGGLFSIVEDNRIGAGLARKGLAERTSWYESQCSSLSQWGGMVIQYDLTAQGVLLRDKLWAEYGRPIHPVHESEDKIGGNAAPGETP
jgi:hypothetical protein